MKGFLGGPTTPDFSPFFKNKLNVYDGMNLILNDVDCLKINALTRESIFFYFLRSRRVKIPVKSLLNEIPEEIPDLIKLQIVLLKVNLNALL